MQQSHSQHASQPAVSVVERDSADAARPRCLIVLAHPERGLSNTLLQHLQQELGGVELTLRDQGTFEAVWFCGYESNADCDSAPRLAAARRLHPEAGLLVTGRAEETPWEDDALAAGADRVRRWPLSMEELRDEIGRLIRARAPHSRAG
ncbi:MAG: hypothetical protein EPO68_01880 [Planctomycetota bacterium]|nr:MAG: hypothetical protein EPO68_01880 [Planctomycetota bacterium]